MTVTNVVYVNIGRDSGVRVHAVRLRAATPKRLWVGGGFWVKASSTPVC